MKLFEIEDRFGNRIELSRERWNHVLKHEIPGPDVLKDCLRDPDEVRQSQYDPDSQLYYRRVNEKFVCVVAQTNEGFIKTAYQTSTKKEGRILWKRKN